MALVIHRFYGEETYIDTPAGRITLIVEPDFEKATSFKLVITAPPEYAITRDDTRVRPAR